MLTQKPAASGTGAATAPRSAARSNTGCSPGPKAAANAAAPTSTRGPWRWTTSCPGTRAVRTTSATCRPSASAATPASAMQFAYARGHHRLPRIAGELRPSPRQLCVLRAGGQRPGDAGERTGAVHRRCLSGNDWAQPGDPASACGRWVGGHQPEWNAVVELLKRRREQLSAHDASISGWNVGLNSGEAAGQTVFHSHWHLIPRRTGDDKSPRGCVRGGVSRANSTTEPWPPRRLRARSLTGQRSWQGSMRPSQLGA